MKISLLNEVVRLAATEATAGLSKLLNEPVAVRITPINIKHKDINVEIKEHYQQDTKFFIMETALVGKVNGVCLFVLPEISGLCLCDVLLHKKNDTTIALGHLEQSALLEVGNIVIGCFLNSLGKIESLSNIMHKKLVLLPLKKFIPLIENNHISDELIVCTSFQMKHLEIDGLCIVYFNQQVLSDETI